jgi:tetrahedral aminopeptidase
MEGSRMNESGQKFLEKLLNTPSPSGFEEAIQAVVREFASQFADEIRTDLHGNCIATCNPQGSPKIMLAGHCDQIGLIVCHIDENGFIYAQTIGGWDPQQLIGQRMTIWSHAGPIPAVIARKPIHLLTEEERKQVVKLTEMWLDIGAKDKKDALESIQIGDSVTLELGMRVMRNSLVNAPGMDNKTGLWVAFEALRRAKAKGIGCSITAVSTVQEEIGLRGATTSTFSVAPEIGIAIDVTHATDCPTIDKRQNGEIGLGQGPVIFAGPNMNRRVTQRLIDLANHHEIPFQRGALGRAASNDANHIQVSRSGVATGLISIPNRYMHSAVEIVSLNDLDHAAELISVFAANAGKGDDFTPWSAPSKDS